VALGTDHELVAFREMSDDLESFLALPAAILIDRHGCSFPVRRLHRQGRRLGTSLIRNGCTHGEERLSISTQDEPSRRVLLRRTPAPREEPTQADATRARTAPQSVPELASDLRFEDHDLRVDRFQGYRAVAGERGLDVSSINKR